MNIFKKGVIKRVIYFVSKYDNQEISYQKEELLGAYLMTYEEAMDAFNLRVLKEYLVRRMILFVQWKKLIKAVLNSWVFK